MKPLISVIIPVFNRKGIIKDALDSVFMQTPKNYEVIVIDDGSTDGTADYIESLNLPIKLISISNGGPSVARNTGIKRASGKYVSFLDSDDVWLPNILKIEAEYLESHPNEVMVYADYYFEVDGNTMIKKTKFNQHIRTDAQMRSTKLPMLTGQALMHISSTMIRRKVFDKIGLFNESLKVFEESDIYNRIGEKYKLGYINKPLAIYRLGKDPNHLVSLKKTKLYITEIKKYMEYYKERRKNKKMRSKEKHSIVESYRIIEDIEKSMKFYEEKKISKQRFYLSRWGTHYLRLKDRDKFYVRVADFVIKIKLRKSLNRGFEGDAQNLILRYLKDFIISPPTQPVDITIFMADNPHEENNFKNSKDLTLFAKTINNKKVIINYGINIYQLDLCFKSVVNFLLSNNDGLLIRSAAVKSKKKVCLFITRYASKEKKSAQLPESKYDILANNLSVVRRIGRKFFFYQHPFLETEYVFLKNIRKYSLGNIFLLTNSEEKIISELSDKSGVFNVLCGKILLPDENSIKTLMEFISLNDFYDFSLKKV